MLGISRHLVLAEHNATACAYKGSVTIVNEAPMNGTCVTPIWVGIHEGTFWVGVHGGTFDTYNNEEAVLGPFDSLTKNGHNVPLKEAFVANGTIWDGVVGEAPLCPGETSTLDFEFTAGKEDTSYYFSYASMVIPSNLAWVSSGNPTAYPVIDEMTAEFLPVTIDVTGSDVLDTGAEVNDELPASMAFFSQETPSINSASSGGILASFPGNDFTQEGYKIMTIKVTGEMVMDDMEESMASGSFGAGIQLPIVICSIFLSMLV